ncbi:protein of unknown function [Hyphomicrobium sp. MC1]|nr:protein of unknown function [Hyphomicrobium sp. MC1]
MGLPLASRPPQVLLALLALSDVALLVEGSGTTLPSSDTVSVHSSAPRASQKRGKRCQNSTPL